MKTCTTCAMKHIASAEIFAHEALAGYKHHVAKCYGQLDHAEMELMQDWPEVAAVIHEQKKFAGDAVDHGDLDLLKKIDWDGLQILMFAVEGKWDMFEYDPNNSKVYDTDYWVNIGMDIRNAHSLPNPDHYYDKWFTEQVSEMRESGNGHVEPQILEDLNL